MVHIKRKGDISKPIRRTRSPSSHKESVFSNRDFLCWKLWLIKNINEKQIANYKKKGSQSKDVLSFIEGMINEKININKEIKSLIDMELKYGGR